jgi:hypothetical protein
VRRGCRSGAASVIRSSSGYLNGENLAGPLTVLATYAAAGTLLMLAAAAWWPRHHAVPAAQGQPT